MISIENSIWENLSRPSGESLAARIAAPQITSIILCALDSEGTRHILILLENKDEYYKDAHSRGIIVETRDLHIHGANPEHYLDIQCIDENGYPIFNIIGGEIVEELSHLPKDPIRIISAILSKWRRFWSQLPSQMLTHQEQIGLFAELLCLDKWLLPKYGSSVVRNWRGPWGSRHDFEWGDKSIEVKATTNSRGRIHKIHGISQLDKLPETSLYVLSVSLREELNAPENLPSLINSCINKLKDSAEELTVFENSLVRRGYSPVFQDEYEKIKFRIIEEALFKVEGDFPKIIQSSFVSGLPPGIEDIEYEINLNTFNHLIIAVNSTRFISDF